MVTAGMMTSAAEGVLDWRGMEPVIKVERATFRSNEVDHPLWVCLDVGDGGIYLSPQQARQLGAALTTAGHFGSRIGRSTPRRLRQG